MPVALAALAAAMIGAASFFAGLGGRRDGRGAAAGLTVAWVASVAGATIGGLLLIVVPPDELTSADVWWSIAAGATISAARPLVYIGMARGPMSVFAPTVSLVSLVVPTIVGPLIGQDLVTLEVVGIVIAVPAVVMVSSMGRLPGAREVLTSHAIGLGVVTGAVVGTIGIFFAQTDTDSGIVPVAIAQAVAVLLIPAAVVVGYPMARPMRGLLRWGLIVGSVDIVAIVANVLAFQRGSVAVVTAILGIAPAVTLVLAWRVLNERLFRLQLYGAALGVAAVVLFAVA